MESSRGNIAGDPQKRGEKIRMVFDRETSKKLGFLMVLWFGRKSLPLIFFEVYGPCMV